MGYMHDTYNSLYLQALVPNYYPSTGGIYSVVYGNSASVTDRYYTTATHFYIPNPRAAGYVNLNCNKNSWVSLWTGSATYSGIDGTGRSSHTWPDSTYIRYTNRIAVSGTFTGRRFAVGSSTSGSFTLAEITTSTSSTNAAVHLSSGGEDGYFYLLKNENAPYTYFDTDFNHNGWNIKTLTLTAIEYFMS